MANIRNDLRGDLPLQQKTETVIKNNLVIKNNFPLLDANELNAYMLLNKYFNTADKNDKWFCSDDKPVIFSSIKYLLGDNQQKTLDIVNQFNNLDTDIKKATMELTTKELSSLYTHVVLYTCSVKDNRVQKSTKRKINLKNTYEKPEEIWNRQDMTGAGLQNISVKVISDTGAVFQYMVDLSIHVQNILYIKNNPDISNFLNLSPTKPVYLLEFGWVDSSKTNLSSTNLDSFTKQKTTLVLNLRNYDLKIHQNGSCTINASFTGGNEDSFGNNNLSNCLYRNSEAQAIIDTMKVAQNSKETAIKAIQQQIDIINKQKISKEEKESQINAQNEALNNVNSSYDSSIGKLNEKLYTLFLHNLNIGPFFNVPKSNGGVFNCFNVFNEKKFQCNILQEKADLMAYSTIANLNNKKKENPNFSSSDVPDYSIFSKITNNSPSEEGSGQYHCPFILLGDILDLAYDNYLNNCKTSNSITNPFILSTMDIMYFNDIINQAFNSLDLKIIGQDAKKYPIYSFPIPYHFFLSWFTNNVISRADTNIIKYDFKLFVKNFMSFVSKLINSYNVFFNNIVSALDNSPMHKSAFLSSCYSQIFFFSKDIDFKSTTFDTFIIIETENTSEIDSNNLTDEETTVDLLFGDFSDYYKSGKLEDNIRENIFHFFVNSETGIVKEYSFNPIRDSAQQTQAIYNSINENLLENRNSVAMFRYETELSLVGSNLFKPGQIIYIDTTLTGMGKSTDPDSLSRKFNIGGYYMIYSVSHSFNLNSFSTSCVAKFIGSGRTIDA